MDEASVEDASLFRSFFLGGFECSTHVNMSGKRLDLIASTGHDRFALQDYQRLSELGIHAAREGIRWHLIETRPYQYDFSSVLSQLRAAQATGAQVIWDLCHYGWPDDLDVFSPEFIERFAGLSRAFTRFLKEVTDDIPYLSPMNEMSFLAWAGGAAALFPPFVRERGTEMKFQLVRATIAGTEAAWEVDPAARIFHIDPICHVVPCPDKPEDAPNAAGYCSAMYDSWDMIAGRYFPELGGDEKYLDVIGVNYYIDNQWEYPGSSESDTTITPSHPFYRPVWDLLKEVHERYRRPLFIAETGIEDERRPEWLRYVCREVRDALRAGVPIHGICLYPILNHLGWEDDRHCHNGLWDFADERGNREIYAPLAEELRRQQRLFEQFRNRSESSVIASAEEDPDEFPGLFPSLKKG
ncbi:MAG: beta-glucosidase [Armatimonadetes bacterium]|nr:beta-glucosidase [Armatimonadota bacterium]